MIRKAIEVTTGTKLIGIYGKAGAGKDTISDLLQQRYENVWQENLADSLKEAAAAAFGIPISQFYDREMKEIRNTFWELSPREIAQYLGTELFRDAIQNLLVNMGRGDFWITRLTGIINGELLGGDCLGGAPDYRTYDSNDTLVVADVRFDNEVAWILENGGHMLCVTRPGISTVGIPGHASESSLNTDDMYHITNDGTMEELYEDVVKFASSINLVSTDISTRL